MHYGTFQPECIQVEMEAFGKRCTTTKSLGLECKVSSARPLLTILSNSQPSSRNKSTTFSSETFKKSNRKNDCFNTHTHWGWMIECSLSRQKLSWSRLFVPNSFTPCLCTGWGIPTKLGSSASMSLTHAPISVLQHSCPPSLHRQCHQYLLEAAWQQTNDMCQTWDHSRGILWGGGGPGPHGPSPPLPRGWRGPQADRSLWRRRTSPARPLQGWTAYAALRPKSCRCPQTWGCTKPRSRVNFWHVFWWFCGHYSTSRICHRRSQIILWLLSSHTFADCLNWYNL